MKLIQNLETSGTPWFSIGDRNWFPNGDGQECAEEYIKYPFICDFRDETQQGHYGPPGTFPGHLELPAIFTPPITLLEHGAKQILAGTLDVGFRSRNLTIGINSYSYTGEFDESTGELLPNSIQGDLIQKNFLSDNYYTGGTFQFK